MLPSETTVLSLPSRFCALHSDRAKHHAAGALQFNHDGMATSSVEIAARMVNCRKRGRVDTADTLRAWPCAENAAHDRGALCRVLALKLRASRELNQFLSMEAERPTQDDAKCIDHLRPTGKQEPGNHDRDEELKKPKKMRLRTYQGALRRPA